MKKDCQFRHSVKFCVPAFGDALFFGKKGGVRVLVQRIVLHGEVVEYNLLRKKVKNINLRIKPDGSVNVSANRNVPQEVIERFLTEKSDFILKAQKRFQSTQKTEKRYETGEIFMLCGQEAELRVFESKRNSVRIEDGFIDLYVKDTNNTDLRLKTMQAWYKKQSENIIGGICERIYPKFQKYAVGFPVLKYRQMVSRWGSCMPKKGIVTFNTALVRAPIECIEYVAVHEFTHFLQPNHSGAFYAKMSEFMPDWKVRKKLLQEMGEEILY